MVSVPPSSIEDRVSLLRSRWERYHAEGSFEQFIELAVTVNSLAEYLNRLRLPGLVRLCEGLENAVLARLGDPAGHPIGGQDMISLQRQIDALLASVATARTPAADRRADQPASVADVSWVKPRSVWLIAAPQKTGLGNGLAQQLQFFGFKVFQFEWGASELPSDMPLAVLFVPAGEDAQPDADACVAAIRERCPASQLLYLGVRPAIEPIVELMRAGIDATFPADEQPSTVLSSILDLVQAHESAQYRVLVVEDSRVAVALIQRTLAQHGIDTRAINDPGTLLEVVASYRPDLVLMDMYMPRVSVG